MATVINTSSNVKGYPSSDNSWEPEANLANSRKKLNEYQRRRKLPISTFDNEPLPPTRQPRTQRHVRRQVRTIQWSTPRRPIPANGGRTPTIRSNTTLDRSDWTKYSARSSRDASDPRAQTPDAFHWKRQTNTNDIPPSTSRSALRANPFRTKTAPKRQHIDSIAEVIPDLTPTPTILKKIKKKISKTFHL